MTLGHSNWTSWSRWNLFPLIKKLHAHAAYHLPFVLHLSSSWSLHFALVQSGPGDRSSTSLAGKVLKNLCNLRVVSTCTQHIGKLTQPGKHESDDPWTWCLRFCSVHLLPCRQTLQILAMLSFGMGLGGMGNGRRMGCGWIDLTRETRTAVSHSQVAQAAGRRRDGPTSRGGGRTPRRTDAKPMETWFPQDYKRLLYTKSVMRWWFLSRKMALSKFCSMPFCCSCMEVNAPFNHIVHD